MKNLISHFPDGEGTLTGSGGNVCVWRRHRQAKPSDANAKPTTANQRRQSIFRRRGLAVVGFAVGPLRLAWHWRRHTHILPPLLLVFPPPQLPAFVSLLHRDCVTQVCKDRRAAIAIALASRPLCECIATVIAAKSRRVHRP